MVPCGVRVRIRWKLKSVLLGLNFSVATHCVTLGKSFDLVRLIPCISKMGRLDPYLTEIVLGLNEILHIISGVSGTTYVSYYNCYY